MTTTGGGPALPGAGPAVPDGERGRARAATRRQPPRLRTVMCLARAEAWLLARSALVLAGLVAGALLIWLFIRSLQPLWWDAGWEIGEGQLILAMAVLAAAQLAAGRARRDGMTGLYASFPATATTRTVALLAGLAGALPASLVLLTGAAVAVALRGPIGTPDPTLLAGGVLLVIAAGAIGVAIGTRLRHPLAGVLGALVLLLVSWESQRFPGAVPWLLPWPSQSNQTGQLGYLPGPLAGYPPTAAHAVELAGLALLAAIVALAVTARTARTRTAPTSTAPTSTAPTRGTLARTGRPGRARARGALAAAGAVALAVICAAGVVQLRPIPTADLNHLVAEAASPASAEHCRTADQVRYCLYPGFGRDLPSLEAPVGAVLALLPARPGQPLTVRQAVSLSLSDPVLTHGHSVRQLSAWAAKLRAAPVNAGPGPASVIYLPVGAWPAGGGQLTDADFNVALAAAQWAVGIPHQASSLANSGFYQACVPLDQAREAISIWLAILATHPPAAQLQSGLGGPGAGRGLAAVNVAGATVPTWYFPSGGAGQVDPGWPGPVTTAAGYLLAHAMTRLSPQKVVAVLKSAWPTWLNWHTSDVRLAAALGIAMPRVPAHTSPGVPRAHPAPGRVTVSLPPHNRPQNPVCTS